MFTETLYFLPLLFQVISSKFFIAEVEGGVEMPQFKPFQSSPVVEKNEEATSSSIKSGSGTSGKVDKAAEHGNDYNDYGSFFMGGKHRNIKFLICLFDSNSRLVQTENKEVKNLQQTQKRMEMWHP